MGVIQLLVSDIRCCRNYAGAQDSILLVNQIASPNGHKPERGLWTVNKNVFPIQLSVVVFPTLSTTFLACQSRQQENQDLLT
jgi:hypothetical protein